MNSEKKRDIALVADDCAETLSMINDVLEQAGFDVLVALEGKQALAIADRLTPDIILLDAMMPNMDGFETCKNLKQRAHLESVPVIFMTGLTETRDVLKGLDCGGVDYLTKPINASELVARIRVHLKNARLTSSAYQALDSTGQHLFVIDAAGATLWATPQTHGLFAKAKVSESWKTTQLAEQLAIWLAHGPEVNQCLPLKMPKSCSALDVLLVNRREDGSYLMKLVDGNKDSGEVILKQALALTTRESQVLYWLTQGKTNREVAQILEMSPRTVNKHLEQIFPKLGVDNRTAAAAKAIGVLAQVAG
ncbi:MAG: DNA-binding response regulator [Alteromonadaceae bacterium]|nr:MAG: DNA-binding response regulator [Alteromonadaceae bacterium]